MGWGVRGASKVPRGAPRAVAGRPKPPATVARLVNRRANDWLEQQAVLQDRVPANDEALAGIEVEEHVGRRAFVHFDRRVKLHLDSGLPSRWEQDRRRKELKKAA